MTCVIPVIYGVNVWQKMRRSKTKYLRLESADQDHKYVGVKLPPHIYNFITLYSMAFNTSKSNIFKQIIEDWMDDLKENEVDIYSLIDDVTTRINAKWIDHKRKHPRASFSRFKKAIEFELSNKGLRVKQIIRILSGIGE